PATFHVRRVTPGYFDAVGIPVLEGRAFEPRDHGDRLGTAVISAGVKAQYWPETSPLGRRVAPSTPWASIVGVVGDVRQVGLDEPIDPTIYLPLLDSVGGGVRPMTVALRTSTAPTAIMPAVRTHIRNLDAELPITDVRTTADIVSES